MTALEELWPLFGLRVRCGPLEMRPVQDADLPEVLAVIQGGIHEPERMPFYFPWTDATGDELVPGRGVAREVVDRARGVA